MLFNSKTLAVLHSREARPNRVILYITMALIFVSIGVVINCLIMAQ